MTLIEITAPCVAQGAPRKVGAQLEVSDSNARLLVSVGRARIVERTTPVVLNDPPSVPKQSRRKLKPEGAPAPSATTPQPEADAPASVE
jgi:hypothetical protein